MGNREGGERSRPGHGLDGGEKHASGVEDGLVCDVTIDGPCGSRSCLDSYPRPSPRLVPRGGCISPRRTGAHHPRWRGGVGAPSHATGDAGRRCPARVAMPPHQVRGHPAPTQALVVPLARPRQRTRSGGIQRRIPHQTLTQGRGEWRGEMDEDWGTEG
jgi:hypothetical protein